MNSKQTDTGNSLLQRPTLGYVIAMVVTAITISFIDGMLPLGVSVGESYALLVLIGLLAKDSRLVIAGAIVGTILIFEGFYISDEGVAMWIVWTNRLLSVFIIWLIAILSSSQLRFLEQQEESEKIKTAYQLLQKEKTTLTLIQDMAVLSNSTYPVEEAFQQSMKKICEFTDWPVAHLYIRNGDEEILTSSKVWVLKDWKQFEAFKEITESTSFTPGLGLPGRVLESRKPAFIKNLHKDTNFPRLDLAKQNGLKSGLAFPIMIGPKVVAVLEFYCNETLEEDEKLIETMELIGYLLGRIFERDHAGLKKGEYEDHLRRLYERMKSVRKQESSMDTQQRVAENLDDALR